MRRPMTGIPTYDPATATFTLPPERADCPTGQGSANLAGSARRLIMARWAT